MPKEVTYFTDLYVLPEFRGRKIGAYLNDCGCDFMRRRGFTTEISFNEEWNQAARRTDAKIAREVKRIRYVKILRFKHFIQNPVPS